MKTLENPIKILPMKYPEITSYPHHANLLSILSYNEDKMSWFYNYYFQLAIYKEGDNRLDFNIGYSINQFIKNCPYITHHGLSREFINKKCLSFSDFIIDSVNLGYYVYFVVDKFYIPAYGMNYHVQHDMLVYGYNTEKQTANIADFFKGGKYNYTECSFSEMEEAYFAGNDLDWLDGVILLKENSNGFIFNIDLLKNYITDYLNSYNSNNRTVIINNSLTDDKYAFGLSIYDILEKHIKKTSQGIFDIRPYHVLWDHKKYILLLIKYLFKNGMLKNADYFNKCFTLIEHKALMLRNLMLKYKISGNSLIIDKLINITRNLAQNEEQYLREMLENISDTFCYNTASPNVTIDGSSLFLDYSENWHNNTTAQGVEYSTEVKGSWVHLAFYGSYISYIAAKNKDCGYADIFIDGDICDSVNLFSSEMRNNETVFTINALQPGFHKIKIVCNHKKDEESCGTKITLENLITQCNYEAMWNTYNLSHDRCADLQWFRSNEINMAGIKIKADSYSRKSGFTTEPCSEGGSNICSSFDGNYMVFNSMKLDTEVDNFEARVAVANACHGGKLEVYLDSLSGKPLGTVFVSKTGGWQKWETNSCKLPKTTGTHDIYLKWVANNLNDYGVFNLNWFRFSNTNSLLANKP
ncbi:carbohydrate-binding protein [Anaerocolumna sp. MB42-C2]|uniref:carbohydrate-binding protein n=1 Tax=Anaerocolumna sp. MB42-C2 TaxID=3070997 RepID=UPI0027E039A9|nr:carbohydrate-binding protein [Anaerocolumna sp. MB42-C2]WMJ86430.1 carbohydrate-binding protein [Anaerocolumna sp. MB42-C2]